ncbi:histidine phosphatase family protein [Candidatus Saccharibacteria bacterium]|nr:histidine phosphatase family protein [Candidatus Saccharibacteria bacterium]
MKNIIFIRHGETDQNLIEQAAAKTNQNHFAGVEDEDYPLNQNGASQVEKTAEDLKNARIDVIFCSPLQRAVQSAEIINKHHHVPIIKRDGLKERRAGDYVGAAFHELFDLDKNIEDESIETIRDFVKRVYGVLDEIAESKYEDIAIVAHGGVHHAVRAYCLKLPLKGNIRVERVKNGEIRLYKLNEEQK